VVVTTSALHDQFLITHRPAAWLLVLDGRAVALDMLVEPVPGRALTTIDASVALRTWSEMPAEAGQDGPSLVSCKAGYLLGSLDADHTPAPISIDASSSPR